MDHTLDPRICKSLLKRNENVMTLGLKVGSDMMGKYKMCNRYCRTRPALSESLFSVF